MDPMGNHHGTVSIPIYSYPMDQWIPQIFPISSEVSHISQEIKPMVVRRKDLIMCRPFPAYSSTVAIILRNSTGLPHYNWQVWKTASFKMYVHLTVRFVHICDSDLHRALKWEQNRSNLLKSPLLLRMKLMTPTRVATHSMSILCNPTSSLSFAMLCSSSLHGFSNFLHHIFRNFFTSFQQLPSGKLT